MSTAVGDWDRQAMRELYRDSAAAQRILDELAGRHKNPNNGATSVDSLAGQGIDRRTAIDLLRAFAENGCGEFRVGRRRKPSRLVWLHSAIEVARDACGGGAGPQGHGATSPPVAQAIRPNVATNTAIHMIEQRVRIRPGVEAVLQIPEDLTQAEAEKLAGIVTNLWL